jgi:hypothetical protein
MLRTKTAARQLIKRIPRESDIESDTSETEIYLEDFHK